MWLLALAVPLTATAFLVGLVRWWLFITRSSQRLAARLHTHAAPEDLRLALADAFDDPGLEIVYWLGDGGAIGATRTDTRSSPRRRRRKAAPYGDRRRRSSGRGDRPRRRAGARSRVRRHGDPYALMTLDNYRLSAQTSSLLRAVRESRPRIQAAADDERRRIERDLHDGAQQRLVALRIKLELAAERTGEGNGNGAAAAAALRRLGDDVEDALEEVRSLARGIYPASLADRGLVEGLRAAALRNPLADHGPRGRHPAPFARGRERRVLLLPGGAPERGEARRRGPAPRLSSCRRTTRCGSRCATTAPASTRRPSWAGSVHQHARPPGRGGRRAGDHLDPGPRDPRHRDHPARHGRRRVAPLPPCGAGTPPVGMCARLASRRVRGRWTG